MPDPSAALADFVTCVGTHLTGDEKGEAADFLDHLFRALGRAGIKEAGATRETRAAYAMPKDADILVFLLPLNQTCVAKEAAGESITPPGLPLPVEEHREFVTEDCIRV